VSEMTAEESMLKCITAIAQKKHLVVNPDETVVATVIRGLVRNKDKYGRAYCPCQLRSGDEEKDRNIECPCTYLLDSISKIGRCKCNLFFKEV
jgi:ferredoxin-thioredoxin reductase catalytic chain